jgi:hypothetical protein
MVENFISESGGFVGGVGCGGEYSLSRFREYIESKYEYSLCELEHITRQIADEYLALGAVSNIQIDSFVYVDTSVSSAHMSASERVDGDSERVDGGGLKLKLYPLVEVNCRRTMGLVVQSLADMHPSARAVEWRLEPVRRKKQPAGGGAGSDTPAAAGESAGCVELSPEGNAFRSFMRVHHT